MATGGDVIYNFKANDKDVNKKVSTLGSKITSIGKSIGKAFAIGTGAAITAISALTKKAVSSYADFEQLEGGIETLFGTGGKSIEQYAKDTGKSVKKVEKEYHGLEASFETVMINANEGYRTAGVSANEYMNIVSSFAASLKQSIKDPVELANAANEAMIDMADNANKMGTSMEMIQNAYQGFAKQNYTMLDNLKLGYGGTKTEMERLLADATKLSGVKYDIKNLGDVYKAIHVIQTELGITGTTAKEAITTITGSANMMKKAWENFVTDLANPEVDIGESLNVLAKSVEVFGKNLLPVIERILITIVNILPDVITKLAKGLPKFMNKLLPPLIKAAMSLLQGLLKAMPQILSLLVSYLPTLIQTLIDMAVLVINTLAQMLPTLIPTVITAILDALLTIVDNIDVIIDAGIQLIMGLIDGILNAIPILLQKAPMIILKLTMALTRQLPKLIVMGIEIIQKIIFGIIKMIPTLIKKAPEIIKDLAKEFKDNVKKFIEVGKELLVGLWDGMKDKIQWVKDKVKGLGKEVLKSIKSIFGIKSPSKEFAIIGKFNMLGLEKGMEDMQPQIQKTIDGMFNLSPSMNGNMNTMVSPNINVVNNIEMKQDPLGQIVNKVKTYSGGAKNDYNYGMGR